MKLDATTGALLGKVVVTIAVVVLVYLLVVRPILQKVGIIETKEDKERDKQAKQLGTSTDSPFSPRYWKAQKGDTVQLIPKATAEQLADQLNDAIGFFSDDENAVYGILRQLNYKTQLSWLADVFFEKYKMDMYQLLNRNLSEEEMDVVNSIATQLR